MSENRATYPRQLHERGGILMVALIAVTLLALMSLALVQLTMSSTGFTMNTEQRLQALFLAESGLAISLNEINTKRDSGTDGIGKVTESWGIDQSLTVTLTDNADKTKKIICLGTINDQLSVGNTISVTRAIEAILIPANGGEDSFPAFFGRDSVFVNGTMTTDSYDSALNTSYATQVSVAGSIDVYRQTAAGSQGSLGTNGNINAVGAAGGVYGAAKPGPTKTLSGNKTISGDKDPSKTTFNPEIPTYAPPIGVTAESPPGSLGAGVYRYSSMPSANLTITGNVTIYLDGEFQQTGTKQITLAAGATLKIIQGPGSNKFTLAGGGVLNTSGDPKNFTVVTSTTGAVKQAGNSTFFGTIYAPESDVTIHGTAETFGAFLGKTLTITGTADVHADLASRFKKPNDRYIVGSEREVLP